MPTFFNIDWLNSNSQRSYPFAEHATKTDVTASVVVPDSFLVELYLPIAAVFDTLPDKFYIQSIAIIGAGYVLNIGYDDGTSDPPTIAVTSISRTNFRENGRYALVGTGDFDDTVGKVVVGRLQEIERLPAGVYTFTPDGGAIDPDCIRPMIRGVSSIAVDQNGVRGPRLRDRVILSAGNGIRLSTIIGPGRDSEIRIDAIPGSLEEACLCDEPQTPCIRTINGIPGDSNQNFTLIGDNCLVITPAGNGLRLEDKCCKPCCGCDELNEVLRALRGTQSSLNTVENFTSRLAGEVREMELTVLSSRLNDTGCGGGGTGNDSESDSESSDSDGSSSSTGGDGFMLVDLTLGVNPGQFRLEWNGTEWFSIAPVGSPYAVSIIEDGDLVVASASSPSVPLVRYSLVSGPADLMDGVCGVCSWSRDSGYGSSGWGASATGACLDEGGNDSSSSGSEGGDGDLNVSISIGIVPGEFHLAWNESDHKWYSYYATPAWGTYGPGAATYTARIEGSSRLILATSDDPDNIMGVYNVVWPGSVMDGVCRGINWNRDTDFPSIGGSTASGACL